MSKNEYYIIAAEVDKYTIAVNYKIRVSDMIVLLLMKNFSYIMNLTLIIFLF